MSDFGPTWQAAFSLIESRAAYAEVAQAWGRAVAEEFPPSGPVHVDPLAFGPWERHDWLFLLAESNRVECDLAEQVARAGDAAVDRFLLVDMDGSELDEDEADEEFMLSDADGAPCPGGYQLHIDTDGAEYWPQTHAACLRILVEELVAHGAVPARVLPEVP